MDSKFRSYSSVAILLSFSLTNLACAQPVIYSETVLAEDEDRIDWTYFFRPDEELLNAEPIAESNGVVSAQWFFEMPAGWLIPESFHVFSDFSNPLDSSLIDNPGLDPYTGEMIAGAVGHSNVTGQYESFTDAVFASFSSKAFMDSTPKPAFSFSTHPPDPYEGYAFWEGGFLEQAGQLWDLGVTVSDHFGTVPGDYNGSGVVEAGDLNLVLSHWGEEAHPAPEGWLYGLPRAPYIDAWELNHVLDHWGNYGAVAASHATPHQVPEPSSGLIITLVLGMALSAFGQRANHNCRPGSARRQS